MDRREFLKASGFLTVSAAAGPLSGCSSHRDGPERLFTHGVASGDPKADSIVLWTRVVDASSGLQDIDVDVEISTDASFGSVVSRASTRALAAFDGTLRHKITGLAPNTTHFYRFLSGRSVSAMGRTKTLPAAGSDPTQMRFAVACCQNWSVNHWGAFDLIVQEDLDFVLHVGDYIYEWDEPPQTGLAVESRHAPLALPAGAPIPGRPSSRAANTLDDYRYLYKTYRSDARLQALHARFPVIAIWDDHEFSNDGWRDHEAYSVANEAQLARRRAANQAWFEYLPADVALDSSNGSYDNIQLYRDFRFGNLAHLVLTDERLYRADHVIDERLTGGSIGARGFVDRDALRAAEAQKLTAGGLDAVSMLGGTQRAWWKARMSETGTVWKLWANPVSLLRMQLDLRQLAAPPFNKMMVLNADQWDGYDAERKDLMSHLRTNNVRNVVSLSGDLHGFFAGQVMDDFDAALPVPRMVDVVTAGISSTPSYTLFKDQVDANHDNLPDGPFAALAPLIFVNAGPAGVINTWNETLGGPLGRIIQQLTGANPYGPLGGMVNNPWLKLVDTDAKGYTSVTVTRTQVTAQLKKVADVQAGAAPANPLASTRTVSIAAGSLDLTMG